MGKRKMKKARSLKSLSSASVSSSRRTPDSDDVVTTDEEEDVVEVDDRGEKVWEVEEIVDYVNEKQAGELYLVKWKGWSSYSNTWEPLESVANCEDALLLFYYKRKQEVSEQLARKAAQEEKEEEDFDIISRKRRRKSVRIWQIPPHPIPIQTRMKEFFTARKIKELSERKLQTMMLEWNRSRMKNPNTCRVGGQDRVTLDKFLEDGTAGDLDDGKFKLLMKELYYVEIDKRKGILDTELANWESKINAVTKGRPFVKVENNVDLEGPPKGFTYIRDCIPGPGIVIPDEPPYGCDCDESCSSNTNKARCCGKFNGSKFAYNRFKKITVPLGTPIFECNKRCNCDSNCNNRVVQNRGDNPSMSLSIFRTLNNCGWGVKTLKPIKEGSFICLYAGEVILMEEAEKRYRNSPQAYLFDLDFDDKDNPMYTIDATTRGNVGRFINHSCSPNVGVYSVWVDCLDVNLPKLAMFARRDIEKDEELCFDYSQGANDQEEKKIRQIQDLSFENPPPSPTKGSKRQPCFCGTKGCRKFIFM